jgi:homoserine O-acetyltransferase
LENKPIITQFHRSQVGANSQLKLSSFCCHYILLVLVNHALTGNSQVVGDNGWWNDLIGVNKTIDTTKYTVLAFNVPGNGFDL